LEHDSSGARDTTPDGDVDEEVLAELFTLLGEGRPDGLLETFDLFLSNVPGRLAAAEEGLANGSLADVGGVAHSLRGTAGAFGARGLAALATRLEEACLAGDEATAAAVVRQMRREYEAVRDVLTARVAAFSAARAGGDRPAAGEG
jgi:HPt (histidine-containing phosphotransfer) domain-containing protein